MKKDADYFEGVEPDLIFVAKRLRDAISLESVLTGAGIDYAVEPDHYEGGVIFRIDARGRVFLRSSGIARKCRGSDARKRIHPSGAVAYNADAVAYNRSGGYLFTWVR